MRTANRIVKNTGILYAKMGLTVFLSLYTTRLILSTLGVTDFGIFNLVGGAIAMLTFLNVAMASATQRFMSFATGAGDHENQKTIFNVSIVLHIIIAVVVVFLLEVIGYILFKSVFKIPHIRIESAKYVYQFMVVSTAFTIISVPYDAVINARENMLLFAVLGVFESLLKLVVAFYLLYTSHDRLIVYGFLMAAVSVFLLVVRRIYCHVYYDECEIGIRKYFDRQIFRELTSFAAWSFLGASSSMLAGYGQGIVINSFFGPAVNAAQGIANQVSGQLGVFAATMLKALNPIIDKSEGAGDRSLMLRASVVGSKLAFFLLMLFFVPVLIEMPLIFKIWLKNTPEYVILFCRLLLIRNLIEQLFVTLTGSIAAVGDIRNFQIFSSLLNIFPLIITGILFYLGYEPFLLYVVFIGFAIAKGGLIIYFTKITCDLPVKDFLKNVGLRCSISFMIIIVLSSLPLIYGVDGMLRLIIVVTISLTSSMIVVWQIGFVQLERRIISSVMVTILNRAKRANVKWF